MEPITGLEYRVVEWDATVDKVRVLKVDSTDVIFQYPDGVTHKVTKHHFVFCMGALIVN